MIFDKFFEVLKIESKIILVFLKSEAKNWFQCDFVFLETNELQNPSYFQSFQCF